VTKETSTTSRAGKIFFASTDLSDFIGASEECCQQIFDNCSVRIHIRNDEGAKKIENQID
jgi:hypothetical protein